MQFAPAHDFEHAFFTGFVDTQRHVVLQLFLQAVPQLAAGNELAFTASQRAGVDAEVHGQRRLVNLEHGQRRRVQRIGHGDANADVGDAVDQHDFAGASFGGLHPLQALEGQHLVDAALEGFAVRPFHHHHVHHRANGAGIDAADPNAANEGGEVDRRDLQLQGCSRIAFVRRHVAQNGVKQGRHVGAPLFARLALVHRRPAIDAGSVDHREIQLFVGRAQLVEQIKRGVNHVLRTRTRLVDLVDHQDRAQAQRQRLLGDESGLRHRAFLRVDQQQHAVDHRQRTLDFTAEVRVAGGVDDVDVRALPAHGAVLGQDGDATFFFDGVVVHHRVNDFLVFSKGAGLAQQLVHHGGFAVVNVGNDRNIADLVGTHGGALPFL